MTTEEQFTEKWKNLESTTRLSFPTWDGRDLEKFLKQMRVAGVDFTRLMALRNVRNTITHNPMLGDSPIVTLNKEVIPFIDGVIERIKHLPTAANILIPRDNVFSGSPEDTVSSVVDMMLKNVYSHVPVLDVGGKVLGVFSESTMLEMSNAGIRNGNDCLLRDVMRFLPCDKHTAEVFRFVPFNDPIAHLRSLFAEALEKNERIGMIFVTKSGRADEPFNQEYDGQVEQENRQSRAQSAHHIDRHRRVGSVGEQGEEAGDELEHGVSGRVPDFQFIGGCDKFAAVPERGGRLDGQQVGHGRHEQRESRSTSVI